MKRLAPLSLIPLALALLTAASSSTFAADAPPRPEKVAGETKAKRDWYPFGGIVASVNKQARTISLKKVEGERVLHQDAKTELTRFGKPATLEEIRPGDYAHGKLHKNAAGEEVIMAAKFDDKVPVKDGEKPKDHGKPAPKN